jgi:alpha-acetolactate decarboxylase
MSIRKGKTVSDDLIGSQVIGFNGTDFHNGIGFSGYHKEILNNQTQTGTVEFCITLKTLKTLVGTSNVTVINRYIYLQAYRQK